MTTVKRRIMCCPRGLLEPCAATSGTHGSEGGLVPRGTGPTRQMRRHDPQTPRAERRLLLTYWAVSGYGLRAARAMAWLLVAMTLTILAMMLWGLASGFHVGGCPRCDRKREECS